MYFMLLQMGRVLQTERGWGLEGSLQTKAPGKHFKAFYTYIEIFLLFLGKLYFDLFYFYDNFNLYSNY